MSRAEDIFQKLIYFGEDAIDEFIINQQTEELFLDFKQAVSVGKNFVTLHRDDRKNLAKECSKATKIIVYEMANKENTLKEFYI